MYIMILSFSFHKNPFFVVYFVVNLTLHSNTWVQNGQVICPVGPFGSYDLKVGILEDTEIFCP